MKHELRSVIFFLHHKATAKTKDDFSSFIPHVKAYFLFRLAALKEYAIEWDFEDFVCKGQGKGMRYVYNTILIREIDNTQ